MTWKSRLKVVIGGLAETALPYLARQIDADEQTEHSVRLKRAIRFRRLERAKRLGDDGQVEAGLTSYWSGESGDHFHARHNAYRFDLFQAVHAHVIDEAARFVARSGTTFSHLLEIGCGDGQVLGYAARRMDGITGAIGVDLNASAIARAREIAGAESDIRFVQADARDGVDAHARPGTILLSYGGVLEYLSQKSVDHLFRTLARTAPAMVILVEPVAKDHDLTSQETSFVFGPENSFSHNHAARLRSAGMTVMYREELWHDGVRWMMMVGVRTGTSDP